MPHYDVRSRARPCLSLGAQVGLPLRGLRLDPRQLNLIGKRCEMQGQPVKQVMLCVVRGEVANQPAFGRVGPGLF